MDCQRVQIYLPQVTIIVINQYMWDSLVKSSVSGYRE